jgi:hypothetical protein
MPPLDNARHEAFAQACARGVRADQAYEDAGFAPGNGHGARLRERKDVAERIAELRAQQTHLQEASAEAVIAALLRITKTCDTAKSPAALREVRLALLDVYRLREELEIERECERQDLSRFEKRRELKTL